MIEDALGLAVCDALRRQCERQGLSIGTEPEWSSASLHGETDPYSAQQSIVAAWQGQARDGHVRFFPDGRVFAEYQVLLPHPQRQDCWVEAVQVWGLPGALKGDLVIRAWSE